MSPTCLFCASRGTTDDPLVQVPMTIPIPAYSLDPYAPREIIGKSTMCTTCAEKVGHKVRTAC